MIERRIKVLIVEDDKDFANALAEYLQYHGFDLSVCNQTVATPDLIDNVEPDLILLDQFVNGDDMMRHLPRIRASFGGPILFLSGNTDASDRVVGLEGGADDFIHKSTTPREILARIRTNLRRSGVIEDNAPAPAASGAQIAAPVVPERAITHKGWTFNYQTRHLTAPNGERVTATPSERDVIWYMLENMGKVLSREAIYAEQRMRRPAADPGRTVDYLISRCRRTVGRIGGALLIESVRNLGYVCYGIQSRDGAGAESSSAAGPDAPSPVEPN